VGLQSGQSALDLAERERESELAMEASKAEKQAAAQALRKCSELR
jgi:hypothetical protein